MAAALLILGVVPGLSAGCGGAPEPQRPHILLLSLDTLRADHLSLYGYGRETDAFLVELAGRSRVFDVAVPSGTWTLPSHVSMFSGLDPAEHGCWRRNGPDSDGGAIPVSPSTALATGPLREAGYHLVAAVGGEFTSQRYGLLRDFHEHKDPGDAYELSARVLNEFIFEILDRRRDEGVERPLFLFANYFDVHGPYAPPTDVDYPFPEDGREPPAVVPQIAPGPDGEASPEFVRDALDNYDREIFALDLELRRLFERLEQDGILDDCLVIITSDHGEMFGELAGQYAHGGIPFEGVARVPLLVHRSGGPVDRIQAPVSLTNLADTMLEEAGLAPLGGGGGIERFSLLSLPDPMPPAFVEFRGPKNWVGFLRDRRFKVGMGIDPEDRSLDMPYFIYDLESDPGESTKLQPKDLVEAGRKDLMKWIQDVPATWGAPPGDVEPVSLSSEDKDRLNALGYGGDD